MDKKQKESCKTPGKRLRRARKTARHTLSSLGIELDISPMRLSKLERGVVEHVYLREALLFELVLGVPRQLWSATCFQSWSEAAEEALRRHDVIVARVAGEVKYVTPEVGGSVLTLVPGRAPAFPACNWPGSWSAFLGRPVAPIEVPGLCSDFRCSSKSSFHLEPEIQIGVQAVELGS